MAETGYTFTDLISLLQQTLTSHLQASYTWIPTAIMATFIVFGLILLVRGAKFAPGFMSIALLGVGAYAGSLVAENTTLPLWPSVGVGAILGAVLGIALFRLVLALSVSALAMLAGIVVFSVTSLVNPLAAWGAQADRFATGGEVLQITVPRDDAVVATGPWAEARGLWEYVTTEVPNFQQKFFAILCSTGIAGLLFGWLMPRGARAFWAATMGLLIFGAGLQRALDTFAPQLLNTIADNGKIAWIVVGVVWIVSFLINLRGAKRTRKPVVTLDDGAYQPATA